MTITGRAEEVAERVVEAMSSAGLTAFSLSEKAGISHPTLRRRLKHHPEFFTVDELVRIAEATGTDFAWLASGQQVAA